MKMLILAVVVLISTTTASYSQGIKEENKRNKVELYYSVCHFFDETKTNWTVLVPGSKLVDGPNGRNTVKEEVLQFPPTFGVQYSRSFDQNHEFRISALVYVFSYDNDSLRPGDVMRRSYGLFSAGYLHQLIGIEKVKINAVGEINYRHGSEMVYIYSPYVWEKRVENLQLRDVGITAGLKIERSLLFNFLISGEAKYTRFIYRYSEGVDFFGQHKDSTPNTLTLKLGLGYQF